MTENPEIPSYLVQGAKTRKSLAREYRMSESTFYRRLKKLDIQLPRGLLLPQDYLCIYQKMGWPVSPAPEPEQKVDGKKA